MKEHKLFKVNQDAILKNNEGEILILRQAEKYKLPGGRLEDNETPQEGLLREIKEETNIKNCSIEKVLRIQLSESQNTYRVTFLCNTEENSVTLSDEHSDYQWIKPENVDNYDFTFEDTKNTIKDFAKF